MKGDVFIRVLFDECISKLLGKDLGRTVPCLKLGIPRPARCGLLSD
jgi:hypothetical protein